MCRHAAQESRVRMTLTPTTACALVLCTCVTHNTHTQDILHTRKVSPVRITCANVVCRYLVRMLWVNDFTRENIHPHIYMYKRIFWTASHTYICMHTHMYTCINICTYIYLCVYIYLHVCVDVYINTLIYIYIYVCSAPSLTAPESRTKYFYMARANTYTYLYVCIYMRIRLYIHINMCVYGVATVSRIGKIIGLVCRKLSLL